MQVSTYRVSLDYPLELILKSSRCRLGADRGRQKQLIPVLLMVNSSELDQSHVPPDRPPSSHPHPPRPDNDSAGLQIPRETGQLTHHGGGDHHVEEEG